MTNQDLNGVWTVLGTTPPASGVAVAEAGCSVSAGEVLIGVDHESRRHLLIPLLPGEAVRADTRGRGVRIDRVTHGSTTYLTVYCLLSELHQVFTQFCRELIVDIVDSSSPAKEAAVALERWRTLFSDAESRGLLGDEALTGLIGELLVVEQLLAEGASNDLCFWVGPFKQVHDMRSSNHAIEVKATLAREGRIVSISGIDQLQESQGSDLFLVHIRLEHNPRGFNLSDVVLRVSNAGARVDQLRIRLNEFGIGLNDISRYDTRTFTVADTRVYDVAGEAFPRLRRMSFIGGDIPPGVLRIGYAIDLTNEPPYPLSDDEVKSAFVALAMASLHEMDT